METSADVKTRNLSLGKKRQAASPYHRPHIIPQQITYHIPRIILHAHKPRILQIPPARDPFTQRCVHARLWNRDALRVIKQCAANTPRLDRHDANAQRGELSPHRPPQSLNSRLARAMRSKQRRTQSRVDAAEVSNHASSLEEQREKRLRNSPDGKDIDVKQAPHFGDGRVGKGHDVDDAGVVDKHVEDEGGDAERGQGRVDLGGGPAPGQDAVAAGVELAGEGGADAAGGAAGDEDGFGQIWTLLRGGIPGL
ncbi:hypothetical protein FZEAL_5563 [Fusarium zealandicum]|uniref:Uncharacterized protein n=1 Tax=Fusarium zealandicum TaxID=1053134 RepID=A0A8H4UJJ0_9HYPO|nr:hypothetical protein FZEAL_5563 [Fusarium zealandicum]